FLEPHRQWIECVVGCPTQDSLTLELELPFSHFAGAMGDARSRERRGRAIRRPGSGIRSSHRCGVGVKAVWQVNTASPAFEVWRVVEEREISDEQNHKYKMITKKEFVGEIANPRQEIYVT
ncbi:MAG: hypothetical protein WCD27_17155, partial [Candidatus Acidiferrales bacterium]